MKKPPQYQTSREGAILVFDKKGSLGNVLALSFGERRVLLSGKDLTEAGHKDKILFIPLKKGGIPVIPDYQYQAMVVVYNGEEDVKEYIYEFVKKADREKIRLALITNLAHVKTLPLEKIIDSYKGVYAVILGEIFAKGELWDTESPTGSILYQASFLSGLKIPGMGMAKAYPVFLEDVLRGIEKVLFAEILSSRVYFLFPRHPITLLSFSRIIKKINPLIKADFTRDENEGGVAQKEYDIPKEGEYLLGQGYRLEEKIRESGLLNEKHEPGRTYLFKNAKTGAVSQGVGKKKKNRHYYGVLLSVLFLVLLPILVTFFSLAAGWYTLLGSKKAIEKGSLAGALANADLSRNAFSLGRSSLVPLRWEMSLLGLDRQASGINKIIAYGEEGSSLIRELIVSFSQTRAVFEGNDPNYQKDFADAGNKIKEAMLILEDLKAGGAFSSNKLFASILKPGSLADVLGGLSNDHKMFGLAGGIADNAPELFGITRKKTYLVLFQNNMELRPGGGFIGSYGLLSFDKGKITSFSIHDVYGADGQLKGRVEPPYPIRRYLSNPNWYLRDSNFDVDFPRDASSSAFFLNQETGEIADGVIAVDVSFIKNLLRATGSVYVPDYNQNVTPNNVYLLTEEHSEKNFFPGSTQKKDFLRSLLTAIEARFNSGKVSYIALFKAINDSINQKHLLFAFSNKNLQNIFTANGASSSLWDSRKPDSATFNDFIGVNEANLGANKANYFLKRKITENVSVDASGRADGSVTVNYANESSAWPGGDYKAYLRFIIPFNSIVNGITIDQQKQRIVPAVTNPDIYGAKNFIPPKGLEADVYNEDGKSIVGFLINVDPNKTKTVTLSYSSLQRIALDSGFFTYDLQVFKQPGTGSDPFALTISYPPGFRVFSSNHKLRSFKNSVSILSRLNMDKDYRVEFARK
ncbi:DUF4012 domain-containing protein [Patescibacteria group bacterium]|nr:DUF4012 domain-containing protein [Patescibacteria group bacterium]MCL5010203.1 DUF4012 domain-containing protein [Patescibacteria group bacterium]